MMHWSENCISHWFPAIEAAQLPVPKTWIVKTPRTVAQDLARIISGEEPRENTVALLDTLLTFCDDIGYPVFLRTGHTSGKHDWKNTCYVTDGDDLPRHISRLAEYSEMVDMFGLPYDVWAAREYLPVKPIALCPRYGDMPVVREFRAFIVGGAFQCIHPYWPREALQEGGVAAANGAYAELCALDDATQANLVELAKRAAHAVEGDWSVDLLETDDGWYVTDMASAGDSFHWPECRHAGGANG